MTGAIDDTYFIDYDTFRLHSELLARVADELGRQDDLWGEQSHPLLVGAYDTHIAATDSVTRHRYEDLANQAKAANDERQRAGCTAWDLILLEEVYEALAEDDPGLAIKELLEVAAVAVNAALSIERFGLLGRS